MSGDDGRDNAHSVTTREVSWTTGSFFSIFFCSIRRPYITFKLPRRDKYTPLRLCNLPDLRRLGCVTSAYLEWPVWSSSSGNNCHAVHRSLSSDASLKRDLHLVPYYQPTTPARFFSIIGHHIRYLRNCRCDHHRAEITIMQFIGQSLPAHHFFLRHSENFYLVSYCEPSCILHFKMTFSLIQLGEGLFYIYIYIYIYLCTQSLQYDHDVTQDQFLCEELSVWTQIFPSPRTVNTPRIKNAISPTIYPLVKGRRNGITPFSWAES